MRFISDTVEAKGGNVAKRTDEQKILFDPYVSVSTIQRYFSLSKVNAVDIFIKTQEADEAKGYIKIYNDRVRSEGVFEVLGLDLTAALNRYKTRQEL